MDGYTLLRDVRELLDESSTSTFMDDRTTYDYLYEAACDLNLRIRGLTSSQTITTVAGQADYDLDKDFMGLYVVDSNGKFTLKINDGTSDSWLSWMDYSDIYRDDSDSTPIPTSFSITDASLSSRLTGTASAVGAAANGESTLTVASSAFSNVSVGDLVHNTTDGSHGVVVAVTSNTQLVTALFDGTNNDWTASDAYIITSTGHYKLTLSPTPSVSGYSLYVPYIQKPEPVYSLYRSYRFPAIYRFAITKLAAWLYKYRDREPNYGDAWYKAYDMMTRVAKNEFKKSTNSSRLKVYLKR